MSNPAVLPIRESVLQKVCAEYFASCGFLVREEVPLWTKSMDIYCVHPITGETLAVEVKVLNWKRGVEQAKFYGLGADKIFIAVGSAYVQRVETEVLRTAGVGLIAVSEQEGCRLVLDPPRSLRCRQSIIDKIWATVFSDLIFPSLLTVS